MSTRSRVRSRMREMKNTAWDVGIATAMGIGVLLFIAKMAWDDWVVERRSGKIPKDKEEVIAKSTQVIQAAKKEPPKLTLVVNNDKPRAPQLPQKSERELG